MGLGYYVDAESSGMTGRSVGGLRQVTSVIGGMPRREEQGSRPRS